MGHSTQHLDDGFGHQKHVQIRAARQTQHLSRGPQKIIAKSAWHKADACKAAWSRCNRHVGPRLMVEPSESYRSSKVFFVHSSSRKRLVGKGNAMQHSFFFAGSGCIKQESEPTAFYCCTAVCAPVKREVHEDCARLGVDPKRGSDVGQAHVVRCR